MINTLVDEIVATLAPRYPSTVSIARYAGRFTERDLDRFAGRAPSLLVSAQHLQSTFFNKIPAQPIHAGDSNPKPRHRLDAQLRIAIAILAKDQPKKSRDAVALELVDTLLKVLPGHSFRNDCRVDPASIKCQNLHSLMLDARAVTLWGVNLDVMARLEYGEPPSYKKPAKVFLAKNEIVP